jgi:hypothetical protein
MERILSRDRGREDAAFRRGQSLADLREQVAAKQSLGLLFEDKPGIPAVRDMRRVDAPHPFATEIEHFAVGEYVRCAVGRVIEPNRLADPPWTAVA